MTTNKNTTRPIVKSTNPALYEQHTYHMSRATPFTLNYSPIDDYIILNWPTNSVPEMASALNEYNHRVQYRVDVLKKLGKIEAKFPSMTNEGKLHKLYLQSWNLTNCLYKELMETNPAALEG